jgi:hypothetical protein
MSDKETSRVIYLMECFLAGRHLSLAEVGETCDLLRKYETWKFNRVVG